MVFWDIHLTAREHFELQNGYQPTSSVFYLLGGSFEIEIDHAVYTVKKGDVIYLPKSLYFKRRVVEPITFYHIRLSEDEAYADMGGLLRYKDIAGVEAVVKLLAQSDEKNVELDRARNVLLESLFCRLKIERCSRSEYDANILRCIDYMNGHLAEDGDLSTFCAVSGYSKTVLIEKFKQSYGMTPIRYFICLRMNEARRLLVDTKYSISEIAERCGFHCPYYFSNTFKTQFGQSPSRYRRNFLI